MPGAKDKLELNGDNFRGDSYSMHLAFESGLKIAKEIEDRNLLKEAQFLVAKQEAICKDLDGAMEIAIKTQRGLNDEMRKWLDKKLGLTP